MPASLVTAEPVDGYITDVAYPAHFHREIMPVWLVNTLAALGRRAPDIGQSFSWLELGCGAGLSTLIAAAANPAGHFTGIDANPREIARAQALADDAGLRNARFICQSLQAAAEAASAQERESCDFIVTHGVYSWVSEANRQAIERIIATRLKPAGVAYVAYMSHPGSASFAAAQKLMGMAARQASGNSAAKARAGMALLQSLSGAGAGYFIEHPSMQREMERAGQMDDAYMAHEFLNAHWHAFHVADVMARFAGIGCEYAGSAAPLENIDAVSLPQGVQAIVAELRRQGADTALLETVRDIARNQNQRRDLYQKTPAGGSNLLTPDQHRQALLAQRVMLLPGAPAGAGGAGELVLDTRIGPVQLPMRHVQPLLSALRQGPRSYAELARLPAYATNPGFVSQLLQTLAWAGWLHFVVPAASGAGGDLQARAQRLQRALGQANLAKWTVIGEAGSAVALGG